MSLENQQAASPESEKASATESGIAPDLLARKKLQDAAIIHLTAQRAKLMAHIDYALTVQRDLEAMRGELAEVNRLLALHAGSVHDKHAAGQAAAG